MDTDNVRLPLLWRLHWHTHLKVDFIILSQMCKDWGKIWAWWRGRGREDGRERDDGMTSPRQWPWVWAHRGRWWRTGKPGVSVGWRRGRQDWALGNKLCEGCAVILQGFHGNRMSVRSSCLISERNSLESSDPRPLRGPAFAQSTPRFIGPWIPLCSDLLLLLRRVGRGQVCAAQQAPPSLGFSRREHWRGLPWPSPMHGSQKRKGSRSVLSDSWQPHGLQPTRLLHPWDFPGKRTGVGAISFSNSTLNHRRASPVARMLKNLPTMQELRVWSLVGWRSHIPQCS